MRVIISYLAATAALSIAVPATAKDRVYSGTFHVQVTGGQGYEEDPLDPSGPRLPFDLTGNLYTLGWLSTETFNVSSPSRPDLTVDALTTQQVNLFGPQINESFTFTSDPYQDIGQAYVGAFYTGYRDYGSFLGYNNTNSGFDTSVEFHFFNGSKSAFGGGSFRLYDDGFQRYLADFRFDIIDGQVFGPAPEPATWALMIAGFGMVGASMRRKTAMLRHA